MTSQTSSLNSRKAKAAHPHGSGHFVAQRASAVALLVLVLWGVYSAVNLATFDYETTVGWLRAPLNAALTALLIAFGAFHMQLGVQTVIEDYIERPFTLGLLLFLNLLFCWLVGAVGVVSVLLVVFAGAF